MTDATGARNRPLLALLDGHSLAFRAFFALPDDLRTSTGQLTNAVYGFTSMLVKLLDEYAPDYLGVVFDLGKPIERLALLPDYKGHREETPDELASQISLILEVLDAAGIPHVAVEGVEADDVIASYAAEAERAGLDTLAVTGDRDVFQIVDDHTHVLYTRRGITDTVLMDRATVEERYGVPPERYPMLAALRGDPSDNIPGVPGVGEKTAAKLLATHGDLETLFANLDAVPGKKLPATLAEHREAVEIGYKVALLYRDLDLPLPVEDLRPAAADPAALERLFATLEFHGLRGRLEEVLGMGATAPVAGGGRGLAGEPRALAGGELAAWLADLAAAPTVALLATTAGHPPGVAVQALALAAAERDPVTVTVAALGGDDHAALAALLAGDGPSLATHGAKALDHAADALGLPRPQVAMDTELAAYLVQPQQRDYGLATLARQYLGEELSDAVTGQGQQQLAVAEDPWQERCRRAGVALELADVLGEALAERGQSALLTELELPLVPVLAEMERTGIAVDLEVLAEIGDSLADRLRSLREDIHGQAGVEFNLDSPRQLQEVLFDGLGLPKTKRIKTGYSTDAQSLATIVDAHPIVALLLDYRELAKLKSTYVDALPPLVHPETGRIHAEFNQAVAVTGRLSSQHPNIQNIPIRTPTGREIRRAFVPGEGFESLLVADYSQIELRVMAHLSGDADLIAAFTGGEDIHATTAAAVWGLAPEEIDEGLRSRAKGMNYGLAYGLSAFGLSQQLGIPPDEARELMNAYLARFHGVGAYLQGVVERARRDGYTATLFGRRRYLPDLTSDNRQRREMAERMALNAPIQGTAADIIKKAMIAVGARMQREQLASQLLLQVHDELVCEVAPGEEAALRALLVEEMGGVVELAVPLEVDTAAGPSWAEALKH